MGGFATYDKGGGVPGTTVYADNVDFTGGGSRTNTINTDGQLLIGQTAATANQNHIVVGQITSPDSSITIGYSSPNITIIANTAGGLVSSLSDDVNTKTFPLAGNIQLQGHVNEQGGSKFSTTVSGANLMKINPMSCARWIVDPLGFNGTHTTLASAMSVATSGDTIFIMAGSTLVENVTLTAGVNITGYTDGNTPTVTIRGKLTFTSAGTVTIAGVRLQTNSDFFLAVTGSAASIVNLINCYLNCSNNTGISYTSSSSSSALNIFNSMGDLGTTGIGFYSMSSAGNILFNNAYLTNSGTSTTQSTNSAGGVTSYYSNFFFPLACSSTGAISGNNSQCSTANVTAITTAGTGGSGWSFGAITAGSGSAVSIGSGTTFTCFCTDFGSTNTNAIAGSGTLNYGYLTFNQSSSTIQSTVTLNPFVNTMNGFKSTVTTAPAAGFIGEQIRSAVASGAAITLTTIIAANVTSINLTAGVWDVTGGVEFLAAAITGTSFQASINTTSATVGTDGDNLFATAYPPTANSSNCVIVPPYRITLTTTTTVFLVVVAVFTVGTLKAYGRISATRVG
jgi:hypothetical protein